jgi:hypothetical protein
MKGCPRHFCPVCGEEMIHRDHRHGDESSSTIGQITHREGPRTFSLADLDGVIRLWLGASDGRTLLRLFEHKQPDAKLKEPQLHILRDLADVLNHAIVCALSPIRLHPESGLFMIYGRVGAAENGRRPTRLEGPQRIYRVARDGTRFRQRLVAVTESHAEFFRWLTAGLDQQRLPSCFPLHNLPIGPGR